MSDSSQRRGTDLNSLRNAGAGTGRLPRDAEDPLAELARLVSQGEPPRPRVADMPPAYAPPRAPEARVEPRVDYTPPPVEPRVPDRLDPLGGGGFRAEPRGPSHARSYGAVTAQPDYDPEDDFFADNPPPLRGSQSYGAYQDDEFETAYDAAFQTRQPFGEDDFDDGVSSVYPAGDDLAEDDVPVRRRGGLLTMGALMSVGLVAGLGAWAYFSLGSGIGGGNSVPPVIEAKTDTPMKVVAEAKPIEKSKKDYDRIPVNADSSIGPAPEEPGEKPRVILPNQAADRASPEPATAAAVMQEPAPNDQVGSVPTSDSGMRVVKTIPISAASLSGASEPAQAAAPPSELPPPIQGSGVAEGMSLQPGKDYSIVNSQPEPTPAAPPAASSPSPQMAFASEQVPLPQPRPLLPQVSAAPQAPAVTAAPQARAATPVQTPAVGGPPSSPQPQVTVTNKRALQPQGAPPPARSSQRTTAPAAPRQIAMAGGSPPPAAAPSAPAAVAPAPVQAPQVAAVSSSSGAFGVQLTAQRSQEEALAAFNALKQRHPQVLGPYTATVARADLGDRGVFYRALVPAQSQADASNLCIQFKSAGVDCIVQRR